MHTFATTLVVVVVFGSALAVYEKHRTGSAEIAADKMISTAAMDDVPVRVAAPGRIEGRTESIELRARIWEQVEDISVGEGDWVCKGDVLVQLDASRLAMEQKLAAAQLAMAEADLDRVENGFRDTEIETARNEYQSRVAELAGAKKHYARFEKLVASNAASYLSLDEYSTSVNSLQGQVAAARSRLATLEAPPREDELDAARAAVAAAQSRLSIATINHSRASILAPTDGQVLRIETEVGELTGPDQELPLVVVSDTRSLRVVAEVDEFDALRVVLGQRAKVTTDSFEGVLAEGSIVEIEPQMQRKQLFSDRPGERNDSFSRRVWIDLDEASDLPVGLPVDVVIEVSREAGELSVDGRQLAVRQSESEAVRQ